MKNIKNFDGFVKESEQVKKDAKKKRAKKDDKGKDTAVMLAHGKVDTGFTE